jgi:pyridinium-3,5-bisthiocarboxylic acid mononucleotide nickel chelatase
LVRIKSHGKRPGEDKVKPGIRRRGMKIAYFDCFSGASGDMILGALVDAGLSARLLRREIEKLRIPTVRLKVSKVLKRGIAATRVVPTGTGEEKHHRNLKEMLSILERSQIEKEIKEKSREIFERIARVEAEIHKTAVEEIHFHELGGLDSIVDIVGAVWGFRQMGFDRVYVSKVNVGSGFVRCEHGILPVPAPATLALMKGKPIYSFGAERELLTPTGAAILTTLGFEFGRIPEMAVEKIGYGAGKDEFAHPNVLRLMIGTPGGAIGDEKVVIIETGIDDMNPQIYDHLMERLLDAGVLDVFLTPILMKKNRPATLVTVIAPPEERILVADLLLKETTTLGLRWHEEERLRADREIVTLQTRHGKIRFKLARWEGKLVNVSPEYEDCRKAALTGNVSLKEVLENAKKEALQLARKA